MAEATVAFFLRDGKGGFVHAGAMKLSDEEGRRVQLVGADVATVASVLERETKRAQLGREIVAQVSAEIARATAMPAGKTTATGALPHAGHEGAPAPAPIGPDGQHGDHWVLPDAERARGFVRPVRQVYQHKRCGATTRMGLKIAETYAANPFFYGRTFCCQCGVYAPVGEAGEFVWCNDKGEPTAEKVGT